MFMVAGSCIATVMVLNYHHRLPDTHDMPDWVGFIRLLTYLLTNILQVSSIFLQWLPWLLRMKRPGKKITRKTIMMHKKMKDLDKKDIVSKSLLVNVMDMEDDFR
jgi:nicotinic acetylcholine receptor